MKKIIKKFLSKLKVLDFDSQWTFKGNRSYLIPDYKFYLRDPKILRYITEFHSSSSFTGHIVNLTSKEENYVNYLKDSLEFMKKKYPKEDFGKMWTNYDKKMLNNILEANVHIFNHIGALSYKAFTPTNPSIESSIREVISSLCLYDYLSPSIKNFNTLHTTLNSGFFIKDNIRLNSKLKSYEEYMIIKNLFDSMLRSNRNKVIKVMEIGWGEGQLSNIILSLLKGKVKFVIIDLPSMHSRAPYFLYKYSKAKVCTYLKFIELGSDIDKIFKEFDVIMLPPWEKQKLIDYDFDLAINMRSISEMSSNEAIDYIKLISNNSDYFFSINTNKKSFDKKTQGLIYDELNILDLIKSNDSDFDVLKTGATIGDSLLLKTPHHVFAVLKNKKRYKQ